MGEKRLYIYESGQQLVFASELMALLRSGEAPFILDPVSIDQYFHHQYVPEPRTAITGVRKLAPGTVLTIETTTWRVARAVTRRSRMLR